MQFLRTFFSITNLLQMWFDPRQIKLSSTELIAFQSLNFYRRSQNVNSYFSLLFHFSFTLYLSLIYLFHNVLISVYSFFSTLQFSLCLLLFLFPSQTIPLFPFFFSTLLLCFSSFIPLPPFTLYFVFLFHSPSLLSSFLPPNLCFSFLFLLSFSLSFFLFLCLFVCVFFLSLPHSVTLSLTHTDKVPP